MNSMPKQSDQVGLIFLLQWWGITILSLPTFLIFVGILSQPENLPIHIIARITIVGVVAGFIFGGAQWVVLHNYLPKANIWVLASIAGFTGGFLLVYGVIQWFNIDLPQPGTFDSNSLGKFILLGLLAIFPSGTLQWLFLRQHVYKASLWLLAWVFGIVGAIGMFILMNLSHVGAPIGNYELLSSILGPGTSLGLITGLSLMFLLNRNKETAQQIITYDLTN